MNIEKFINDQLSVWPLACGNFRALRDVRTKRVTVNGLEVILQHNPARIVSSAAKLDAGTLKTRKCFLCRENRPPEQMRLDFEGRKDRKYDILLNPYPIFRNHLVIAMKEHTPQSIWRRYVDMLDLAKALKDYTVFYNGPECGASAPDHHHFQAAPRGLMPLENDMDRLLGMKAGPGECLRPGKLPETGTGARQESETGGLRHIASNLDADLFLYEKYLHGIFVIRGATSKSVAKLFYRLLDCAAIDSLSVPVGGTEDSSASNTSLTPAGSTTAEPKCNVFVWYEAGEYRSAVVFRSVHRSHHYFSDGPDHLTMSPGCADMAGCLVVPVAGEFEKIDEASVESLLTEVSLDGNAEKRIVDRLVRSQKEVSVGIMSAPEIVFEIFTDGAGARKAKFRDGKIEYDGSLYDELFFEAKTSSTMFAEPSFRLYGVTIGAGFHWERKEEQLFAGALKIIVDGDKLTAVNMIGIEDYLVSVISSEMKPTAPIEFLKAHAVISRSWVMRMVMHGNAGAAATDPHAEDADAMTPVVKMDNDSHPAMSMSEAHDNTIEIIRWYDTENHDRFDVCADDHCQRYQGLSRATDPAAKRAVDETWGQVLMSGGEICDARFSKCCGGITEKFSSCWADADYEYLEGGQKCGCGRATPDLLSKVLNSYDLETDDWYRWQVEYGREELTELFARRSGLETGEIRSMIPLERGVSGRIVKLEITGSEKTAVIGKELEIRRVLSETHLKSSAFDIEYLDAAGNIVPDEAVYAAAGSSARPVFEKIRLKGSGWGHGVGLCQIGAAVMASAGSSYAAILSHYYPASFLA